MKVKIVKMLQSAATQQVSLPKGAVVRLPAEVAEDFIRGGLAKEVKSEEIGTAAKRRETRKLKTNKIVKDA